MMHAASCNSWSPVVKKWKRPKRPAEKNWVGVGKANGNLWNMYRSLILQLTRLWNAYLWQVTSEREPLFFVTSFGWEEGNTGTYKASTRYFIPDSSGSTRSTGASGKTTPYCLIYYLNTEEHVLIFWFCKFCKCKNCFDLHWQQFPTNAFVFGVLLVWVNHFNHSSIQNLSFQWSQHLISWLCIDDKNNYFLLCTLWKQTLAMTIDNTKAYIGAIKSDFNWYKCC